jgi:phospholipase/carboxylesterase
MDYLPCVEIEPQEQAQSSVIWLHGLGANGHDFESIVPELGISTKSVRFIFPHAPSIPVSINNGMRMPAWYDISNLDLEKKIDQPQLEKSAEEIGKLILRENERGILSKNIIIAGFSQGGAVGYEVALSYKDSLAGLVALSTYFPTKNTVKYSVENKSIPVFIGHGNQDQMVSAELGIEAHRHLQDRSYPVEYHSYEVGHGVNLEEIKDIGIWINKALDLE